MSVQIANIRPEDSEFPARTSYGTRGRKIRPSTNYFEIQFTRKPVLYQIDVKFSETKLPPEKRREIFQQLRIQYPKIKLYYDGTAIAATDAKFEGGAEMMAIEVTLPSSGANGKPIKVTLKIVATLNYSDLAGYLSAKHDQTPKSQSYLNLLNIYLFHFAANDPSLAAFEKTRSFFMLNGRREHLPEGLDLLFGGFMSVRPAGADLKMKPLEKLYLNVDTIATTFLTNGPLLVRLQEILPRANLNSKLTSRDIAIADKFLKKIKITASHRGPTWKRKYTIDSITRDSAAQTTFDMDGKKVSVAQYFQSQYSIKLKHPNLPCVVVKGGPDGKMFLPIEVCEIPDGIRHRGHLTGAQTSEIIKSTATKPLERAKKIQSLLSIISAGQSKDNSLGINLSDKMVIVDGRVLPEPEVKYGRAGLTRPKQGSWNTLKFTFTDPKRLDSWALIDFRGDAHIANSFVSSFVQSANGRGMSINPKPIISSANPNGNLEQILSGVASRTKDIQMFMFILPLETGTLYPALKLICDCKIGVLTQCVVFRKLQRANDQYYSNVALKVNNKLGGTNHALKDRLPMFDKPTMILGADVTHPPGGSNAPSIAAVVSTITADTNIYVERHDFQQSGKEFITKFEDMALDLINLFRLRSTVLPERIIYYRDGVGENMRKEVKRQEIAALIRAFDRVQKPYSNNIKTPVYRPSITMIIAQKRHHTRFIPNSQQDQDRSQNCPAGMVVDNTITRIKEYDFYLQSQAGLQGTSRPTHYNIIHDENKFTPDAVEELTYRMCYLQGRCTRSVSIVPAIYHADLVCFRARSHLKDPEGWSQSSSGKGIELNLEDVYYKVSPKLGRKMWWV